METARVPAAPVDAPSLQPPAPPAELRATVPSPPPLRRGVPVALGGTAGLVLVATLDRAGVHRLARRLLGRADVRRVGRAFDLLHAVESHAGTQPVVIIDCCAPSVEPEAVATMLGALGTLPVVVLWGASDRVHQAVCRLSPAARNWIRLGANSTDAEVAELVQAVL